MINENEYNIEKFWVIKYLKNNKHNWRCKTKPPKRKGSKSVEISNKLICSINEFILNSKKNTNFDKKDFDLNNIKGLESNMIIRDENNKPIHLRKHKSGRNLSRFLFKKPKKKKRRKSDKKTFVIENVECNIDKNYSIFETFVPVAQIAKKGVLLEKYK